MWRKIVFRSCVGTFGILLLVLLLMQTQPVERLIFSNLQEILADFGFQLEAERMDLNPFTLKVDFQKLSLKSDYLDAKAHKASFNASTGVLVGAIDLDQIHLSEAVVLFDPDKLPQSEPEPNPQPLKLPKVKLREAKLENLRLEVGSQKQDINLTLSDIGFEYLNNQLKAEVRLKPLTIAERQLPELLAKLQFKSEHFQRFDDLQVNLETDKSNIKITGSVDESLTPNLSYNAAVGDDLLSELPGLVNLNGSFDGDLVIANAEHDLVFQQRTFPTLVKMQTRLSQSPMVVPIDIVSEGLATIAGEVRYNPDMLAGELTVKGEPKVAKVFAPMVDLQAIDLKTSWEMADLDVANLVAKAEANLQGWPATQVSATYQNGVMLAQGEVVIDPSRPATQFEARYEDSLSVTARGGLSNLDLANVVVEIPPQLCSSGVVFDLALEIDGENYLVNPSFLAIEDVTFDPVSTGPLLLTTQGPLTNLQGKLWAPDLQDEGDAIDFAADLIQKQKWHHLEILLNKLPLPELPYQAELDVGLSASGPLTQPTALGLIQGELLEEGTIANLVAPVSLTREALEIRNLSFATAEIDGFADFQAQLQENLTWQLDMTVQKNDNPQYQALVPVVIPEFKLKLNGNQEALKGALTMPDQAYEIEELALPIAGQPFQFNIDPQQGSASGELPFIEIAGIRLHQTSLQASNEGIGIKSKLEIVDPILMEDVFGHLIPEMVQINAASAELCLDSDWSFEEPYMAADVRYFDALINNEPLYIERLHTYFGPTLYVAPFDLNFAGLALQAEVGEVPMRFRDLAEDNFDELAVKASLELKDLTKLKGFAGESWPKDLLVEEFKAEVSAFYNPEKGPHVLFNLASLKADYDGQEIVGQNLRGSFVNQGLNLQPGKLQVGSLELVIHKKASGFRMVAEPTASFLADWGVPVVGRTSFTTTIDWTNIGNGAFTLKGLIKQDDGKLVFQDPLLEITKLELPFQIEPGGRLVFDPGSATLNKGKLEVDGHVDFSAPEPDIRIGLFVDNVDIVNAAYQVRLTSALEYQRNQENNRVTSTVQIERGFFHPEFKIETLVTDLLAGDDELYFPDPMLEEIDLQAMVIAKEPLVVSTNIGYFELETPGLLIQGNLAEPIPSQGMILIKEGSLLESGQKTLFFQDSYVRFEANRPNDPYLQIAISEPNFDSEDNLLTIFGYMSELGQSVSGTNVNALLVNYVLGRVSSLVTLEVVFGDNTLLNSDFTTVVSRAITSRAELRLIFNNSEQQADRILELRFGPFYRNYLTLQDRGNSGYVGITHRQKLGYLQDNRSEIINDVDFIPKDLPYRVKIQFGILRGAPFTETTWRRGVWEATRYLRRQGYLGSSVEHTFEDGELKIYIEMGNQVTINVDGIEFTESDRERLFMQLRNEELNERKIGLILESMARSKGHSSVAAFVTIEGSNIEASIVKAATVDDVKLNFGKAHPILEGRFTEKQSRALINQLLIDDRAQREKIRAKLAARGYLTPEFDDPYFKDDFTFVLPIEPGPRSILKATYVNEKPFNFTDNGKPFTFSMMGEAAKQVLDTRKGTPAMTIEPQRVDGDLVLQITVTDRPDPTVESLTVQGTGRVTSDRVEDFLGFEPGMKQSVLVDRQKQLLRTGAYQKARMQVTNGAATLEVEERNRWDINYEVNWGEVDGFGYGIQATDRFVGHRLYNATIRANRSAEADTFLGAVNFPRFRGSIFDVRIGTDWDKERRERGPKTIEKISGLEDKQYNTLFRRTYNLGMNYPIFENQRLTHTLERTKRALSIRTLVEEFDLDTFEVVTNEVVSESETTQNTLRNSWTYEDLDNPASPKNGLFLQGTVEWFPEWLGTSDSIAGTRYIAKFSQYRTSGRWYWGQRVEGGYFWQNVKQESRTPEDQRDSDSLFFELGGPNTLRGYRTGYVGPLQITRDTDENGNPVSDPFLAPFGGQAFVLITQEVNYDFYWQGLGLSPFIDAGYVWDAPQDIFSTDLAVSGGIGLTWDSPIGFLRLDYAWQIDRGNLDNEIRQAYEEGLSEDANFNLDEVNQEWSLRFGRVF